MNEQNRKMSSSNRKQAILVSITILLLPVILLQAFIFHERAVAEVDEANFEKAEELTQEGHSLKIEGDNAESEGRNEDALDLYGQAIIRYEEARELEPNALIYNDYIDLAACYKKLDQYDKAISTINEGITIMQENDQGDETQQLYAYQLYIYLAEIYKELGDYEKALEIYMSQSDRGENDMGWYHGLADYYIEIGDIETAKSVYENGFNRIIFDNSLYLWFVEFLLDHNLLDKAEEITYRAIVFLRDDPYSIAYAYQKLLEIYEKQGRSGELLDFVEGRLEEALLEREEYLEQPTQSEHTTVMYLILFSIVLVLIVLIIILIIWLRLRRKKRGLEKKRVTYKD